MRTGRQVVVWHNMCQRRERRPPDGCFRRALGGDAVLYLSFTWTTPALLAGAKTATRLPLADSHLGCWRAGMLVTAYREAPADGGRPVAVLQLTADPALEPLSTTPDSDYEAEGWAWLHEHQGLLPRWIAAGDCCPQAFREWRTRATEMWVVRFRVVAVATADQIGEALAEAMAAQPVAA